MNRRELLQIWGPAAIGVVVAGRVVAGSAFGSLPSERLRTVHEMIEQSGAMWLGVRDREDGHHPIVIYFGDADAYELRYDGQWKIESRSLTTTEQGEFAEYIKDVSNHLGTEIGARLYPDSDRHIRAWIKNGRKHGWNVSAKEL